MRLKSISPMRLQDEIEIPFSPKTTMADEDKKFGDEETISWSVRFARLSICRQTR